LGGKAPLSHAVRCLPKMPWIVGIRAVETVWAEMKITARNQLLRGLAEDESEQARRIRLSLARALYKLDPAAGLKLLLGVCKEVREKETGALSPKNAQIFNNVFIGKAKPWLTQVSLPDLKPADADLLVQCALAAAFSQPNPPVPLLGLLKWAGQANLLSQLPESTLAILPRGLSRMSLKWQNAIRKEVSHLPESILALLKPAQPQNPRPSVEEQAPAEAPAADIENAEADSEGGEESKAATEQDADEGPDAEETEGENTEETEETVSPELSDDEKDLDDEDAESEEAEEPAQPRKPRPVYEPRPQRTSGQRDSRESRDSRDPREFRDNRDNRDAGGESGRRDRPVYQSRTVGAFNLPETLRQIENHVQSLRLELNTAQSKLRQRDDDPRREKRTDKPVPLPGAPSNEELTRLNLQLESRITELQARIDEIEVDAEDRAASLGAHTSEPVADVDQQLRTLLGLKLQEDYADFVALENESTSTVVQQHYRSLLRHIFEVLITEKIPFQR
jgi:hypothetical protein